ncbi:MAG: hypothetical protein WC979_04550 [Candidatus Pacearchaeota archaeon]|jgi:hypothetical protein
MKKKIKVTKVKEFFIDRMEIMAFILFVLALFLMDVNMNKVMDQGIDTTVTVIGSHEIAATSGFWAGFLASLVLFFFISFRSLYERKNRLSYLDIIFGIIGVIGLMITLSGGLIAFWHNSSLVIPFFNYTFSRVNYYHTGIGLDIFALFYFALTKSSKK